MFYKYLFKCSCFMFPLITAVVAAGVEPARTGGSVDPKCPVFSGEKLTFRLKWGIITAGTAVLETLPMETVKNTDAYHFVLTVKSNKYVDLIYKVRSRIDAYTDAGMNRSLLYKKKQEEGRHKRDVTVDFDWEKNETTYTKSGSKGEPVSLLPGSFDPLAAFYHIRCFELKKGMKIRCNVADGKKSIKGTASVLKKEKIKSGDKKYNAFLVEPDLKDAGGIFKKSKNAKLHIWLSDDKTRMPVKIKSKVVIGNFTGELISAE